MTGVLFDLDGVIIDSQPVHYQVDIDLFHKLGAPIGMEEMRQYAGTTNAYRFSKIIADYKLKQDLNEVCILRNKLILTAIQRTPLAPMDGVVSLICDLYDHNVKMAVASSSSGAFIEYVLQRLGLAQYFEACISGEEVLRGKPAPDIFLEASKAIGVLPGQCIVIEDSAYGIEAAVAAGMKSIGYVNPATGKQDLSASNLIVDDFTQLNYVVIEQVLKDKFS